MTTFFRRFIGALMLDAAAFEDIEHDGSAAMQSVTVCGVPQRRDCRHGSRVIGIAGIAAGAVVVLGAWLTWVTVIAAVGTIALAGQGDDSSLQGCCGRWGLPPRRRFLVRGDARRGAVRDRRWFPSG